MKNKHLVTVVLISILITTSVQFSNMVYAKNENDGRAQAFLTVAERSVEQLENLMELVNAEESIEVPDEALTYYELGLNLFDQASVAFGNGDYNEAIQFAKDSLWNNREAIKELNKVLESREIEVELDGATSDLVEAIARARNRIARVLDLIETMLVSYPSIDVTGIMSEIREMVEIDAEGHLVEAENLFGTGNVSGAAKELGNANRVISNTFVSLRKQVKGTLNNNKIKSFITVINNFFDKVNRQTEQKIEDQELKTQLKTELNIVYTLLQEAEEGSVFNEQVSKLMKARSLLESTEQTIKEALKGKPE